MQNEPNCDGRIQNTGDRIQKEKMQNEPNLDWRQIGVSSFRTSKYEELWGFEHKKNEPNPSTMLHSARAHGRGQDRLYLAPRPLA